MSEPASSTRSGLFVTRGAAPVPLLGVDVHAEIRDFYARVVVTQRYANRESMPIEAVYVFPLDEGAAVCGFEAVVDDTLVVGEVHERDKAFGMYDDAMAEGHGAFLLDEERPDVFQASIGNVLPGKEVLVRLTYVTELAVDAGRLRFTVPTTVSPRYAPASDRQGIGRSDAEALNPPVAWSVPYGLEFTARLSMRGTIFGVECLSHPLSITHKGCSADVQLAQAEAALDRDIVLSVAAEGLDAPYASVERGADGDDILAVAFAPDLPAAKAPAEVVFVVDRSGSMEGTSIAEVRNALQLCLRSLVPGCRFNIVSFGSSWEALFPESRPYDDESLAAAARHVATMDANLGGTEILGALTFALEQARAAELPRQVVVLTDGQVTNTDAVLALVRQHQHDARVFTFGIGAGASAHLVRGLARAGRGSAEFIAPGERIEPKVLRQLARLLSPALTDVRVEWNGGRVRQSPTEIPAVFANGRLVVYGFVDGSRPTSATLMAKPSTGALSFEVPIGEGTITPSGIVAPLAARARIRELEEGDEWLAARGSRQRGRKAGAVRDEIIALSVRYGIMSRETSFVAIERRETPVIGDVQLRKVPIALTSGWGGSRAVPPFARLSAAMPAMPAMSLSDLDSENADADEGPLFAARRAAGPSASSENFFARLLSPGRPRARRDERRERMHALITRQRADGTWELDDDLADILHVPLRALVREIRDASGAEHDVRRAWATALAIAWLQLRVRDMEDEWRMLADKAGSWLDHVRATPAGSETWIDAALELLRAKASR